MNARRSCGKLFLKSAKISEHHYAYIMETSPENLVKTVQTTLRTQNEIIRSLNKLIDFLLESYEEE